MVTDCERLDAALSSISKHGIMVRKNFGNYRYDSRLAIVNEAAAVFTAGIKIKGYVTYCNVDVDIAIESGWLDCFRVVLVKIISR